MIIGIGTDIEEIARLRELIKNPRFLGKYYTAEEREYVAGKGKMASYAAGGIFCAKEAFAKAVGSGVRGFSLSQIEVGHTAEGKPWIRPPECVLKKHPGLRIEVSISHCRQYVTAVCIAFTEGRDGE